MCPSCPEVVLCSSNESTLPRGVRAYICTYILCTYELSLHHPFVWYVTGPSTYTSNLHMILCTFHTTKFLSIYHQGYYGLRISVDMRPTFFTVIVTCFMYTFTPIKPCTERASLLLPRVLAVCFRRPSAGLAVSGGRVPPEEQGSRGYLISSQPRLGKECKEEVAYDKCIYECEKCTRSVSIYLVTDLFACTNACL